ncbi:hypothetical protein [Streptomyces sp. NPDC060022]|uniref:hypothetical protein n=1 Tax=Streptomyces sp. NPDC060022 TaxID=3347039 RepID=UPI00369F1FA4
MSRSGPRMPASSSLGTGPTASSVDLTDEASLSPEERRHSERVVTIDQVDH